MFYCALYWLVLLGKLGLLSPVVNQSFSPEHISVNTTSHTTLTVTASDNGLSPGRRQAIIWTNAWILLIGPQGKKLQWNFNRNWIIFIQENAFENVVWYMTVILSRPQCQDLICYKVEVWGKQRWIYFLLSENEKDICLSKKYPASYMCENKDQSPKSNEDICIVVFS